MKTVTNIKTVTNVKIIAAKCKNDCVRCENVSLNVDMIKQTTCMYQWRMAKCTDALHG